MARTSQARILKPMEHAVFLDVETLDRDDLDLSRLRASMPDWDLHATTEAKDVAARIADADVIVTNKVVLDTPALEAAEHLKLVCVAATGTNNIDLEAARRKGIAVCNVRDYGTPSVVEHVFALILALRRRLIDYRCALSRGEWQASPHFCLLDYPMTELRDKVLGIIGYGVLGRAVAQVAEAFGMRLLISERPGGPAVPGRTPLPELLEVADVISLHCPLTEHTKGLIGAPELARMKADAVLINTARGAIVDPDALVRALRAGAIGGAGIDVLDTEPPRAGHPLLKADLPNLIVTPHVAWASREARQRLADQLADNIEAFRGGHPINLVVSP